MKNGRLDPFTIALRGEPVFLEDCEFHVGGIQISHLEEMHKLIPWVLRFRGHHMDYYPLYLSLRLCEKAYFEETPEVRHLLRVMALEALVSAEDEFGKTALKKRIPKLIGDPVDLYEQYEASSARRLPSMNLCDVLNDVCELRNKIAHGDRPPVQWFEANRRQGDGGRLSYVDELREAAAAIVSLAWLRILRENLMETMTDKTKMRAFLSP